MQQMDSDAEFDAWLQAVNEDIIAALELVVDTEADLRRITQQED